MGTRWSVLVLALWAVGCGDPNTKSLDGGDGDDDGGVIVTPPPDGGGGTPDGGGDAGTPDAGPSCTSYCEPSAPAVLNRHPASNPIPDENAQPGDWGWRDGLEANNGEVEVYASADSVRTGDELEVKVSASASSNVTATVYRMGWYGGPGARKLWTGGPYPVSKQQTCAFDETTGLVECDWQTTFTVKIDPKWVSGLYVVKVLRGDGYKRFAPFVVRDARAAEILYTPNFTTYQAYNTYGGESLYADASGKMPRGRAHMVSFNRPYAASDGLGKTFSLDQSLISLLEKNGYDISYATQTDFLRFKNVLEDVGAFVWGGQDEYWPSVERTQTDAALAGGKMSLAYFGANGGYWRVRFLSDKDGNPLRTMVCFKSEPEDDPQPYSTIRFRDDPNAQPENNLFGVMYEGYVTVPFPLAVTDTSHWLFAGTNLQSGDLLPGLVGFEYDRAFPELAGYPSGVSTVLRSPVVSAEGVPSYTTAVERTLPSGTLVFSAGTIWWPLALGTDPELRDGRVARMTLNVVERALQHVRPQRQLAPASGPVPAAPQPNGLWAQSVTQFVGLVDQPGYVDGPMSVAKFKAPTGLATTSVGELIVADTGNNRLRLVRTDALRTVVTLAGNGDLGYRDGEASQAMFRVPTDVAVGPDGAIYVADSDNHAIRKIVSDGNGGWTVSTVAGKGFTAGFADGVGTAARFNRPVALDLDAVGNLYVADQGNNRIRMIPAGTQQVVTLAGNGGWGTKDAAVGTQASFAVPSALTVTPTGEVYVMDSGSQLMRRLNADATRSVVTIAGDRNAWFGYEDGAGDKMRARAQMGMAMTPEGHVLFADTANFRIRKVVPGATPADAVVYTIAGSGKAGTALGSGDVADIAAPTGLTEGPNQKFYVSDSFHHVIREITR